jgi:hypothetical protein
MAQTWWDGQVSTPEAVPAPGVVTELVGVYDAEGSWRGELRYLIGRWRKTAHCELCDITHGTLRQKAEFRAVVAALPVPWRAVHLDERDAAMHAASDGRTPCVLARSGGRYVEVLDSGRLAACDGDPEAFATALLDAIAARGLRLGA